MDKLITTMVIKPNVCVKIVEHLSKEQPGLIEDAFKQVEKPEAYYIFLNTITPIFSSFCDYRKITKDTIRGVHISRSAVYERILFISTILWLYSPAIYNQRVKYSVEDGLRHELWGILKCNKEWISQQVDSISRMYNMNYQEFKDQVNDLLAYIKEEVKEDVVVEQEEKEPIAMFQ